MHAISDRRRILEIAAVLLTAAGKFVFMDVLASRTSFIVIATVLWASYIFFRHREKSSITKYWGFRTDNFKQTIKIALPFAIAALAIFFAIGVIQHTVNVTWHILPLLILYPLWGVIQQFLLIGLTTGNLNDMKEWNVPKALSIVLPAFLFGIIHYPFVWLIIGSTILGLFYGWIYLKQRNIYVLGILHGWLGACFFYTVVNRDPFAEIFGRLL